MQSPWNIQTIAVLGAGVMGAQIAAHCANAGFATRLYDLPSATGDASAIAVKAIAGLGKLKPPPLGFSGSAAGITACNYDEHLEALLECDLVIEAIAERFDWKEALYKRIIPFLGAHAILVTNTSGLGINALSEALPAALQERFCGVHFFNPPRYMHLCELIPSQKTHPKLCDYLETWLTRFLGKGVVRAKDTPNFVANRIGVFSMLTALHHAKTYGLGCDTVDALTGPLIGRPKSATFRTMDVVGLDTLEHVVKTMQNQLPDDPWHALFFLPDWLKGLISAGALGQKSGSGVYRKNGKTIEVYDVESGSYRAAQNGVREEVRALFAVKDPGARFEGLLASTLPEAQFLVACLRDVFHYSAFHLDAIANTARDVDEAMKWGFGWQEGPFETWQKAGMKTVFDCISQAIADGRSPRNATLPAWLAPLTAFYVNDGAFSPAGNALVPPSSLPVYARQLAVARNPMATPEPHETLYENKGVRLWHLADNVAVLSFLSKANSIGEPVLEGMQAALDIAESRCSGVIIWQTDASTFSAGADLKAVGELAVAGEFSAIEGMIERFQKLMMRIKYSPIPVVAALRGRALGGGCELLMHCGAVVAAFESYPGLVEVGVGLIPAGGGCKEMVLRTFEEGIETFATLQKRFQQLATGFVPGSAVEAQKTGYLDAKASWVMHSGEVLYVALERVKAMCAANYRPPLPARFQVYGREGRARLQSGLVNWREGGFISAHDYVLATHLANVLCGGEVYGGQWVDEDWMLHLEREAFMALVKTPETQARIRAMLETGKPLRN